MENSKLFVCSYRIKGEPQSQSHAIIVIERDQESARTKVTKLLNHNEEINSIRSAPYVTALEKDLNVLAEAA